MFRHKRQVDQQVLRNNHSFLPNFFALSFHNAHLAYLKKKNAKKKKKEKNVQAHCVEPVHPVPINIEETGWNQNTEGPYYGGNAGRIDL